MLPKDAVRIRHMIDAAENAQRFIEGRHRADLDTDIMLVFALILREIRGEMREQRALLLQFVDANQRAAGRFDVIERRISDLRPDLELMLKGELLGRLGHFETQIEHRIDELEARLSSKTG